MAKKPDATAPGAAPLEGEVLAPFVATVTAPAARRRAGLSFGPTPVYLTREQLETELEDGRVVAEVLEADPVLVLRAYKPDPVEAEASKE